jgi:hypothetical protein
VIRPGQRPSLGVINSNIHVRYLVTYNRTLISYSNRYTCPCGFPCYNTCQKRHRCKVDGDDNTVKKLTNLTFIATIQYKYPFASMTKPCIIPRYLFKTFSTYTSAFHLFRPCRELVQANAIHVQVLAKEQDSAFPFKDALSVMNENCKIFTFLFNILSFSCRYLKTHDEVQDKPRHALNCTVESVRLRRALQHHRGASRPIRNLSLQPCFKRKLKSLDSFVVYVCHHVNSQSICMAPITAKHPP